MWQRENFAAGIGNRTDLQQPGQKTYKRHNWRPSDNVPDYCAPTPSPRPKLEILWCTVATWSQCRKSVQQRQPSGCLPRSNSMFVFCKSRCPTLFFVTRRGPPRTITDHRRIIVGFPLNHRPSIALFFVNFNRKQEITNDKNVNNHVQLRHNRTP